MHKKYTKRQEDFIRNNFQQYTIYELADKFNKKFKTNYSYRNIKDKKYDMGLVKYKQKVVKATYSEKEIKFLKKKYKGRTYDELTRLFNKKFNRNVTRQQIKEIKYKYLPDNVKIKGKNEIPLYSERIDTSGEIVIKIANNKRIAKARYVWEKKYGKIPKGYSIVHLDGNKLNNKLNNLKLVSDKELAMLNRSQLCTKHKSLTKVGIKIIKLTLIAYNRKKEIEF